jgi:Rad3-related DNA helicase
MINKKTKEEYFDALEDKIEDFIGESSYVDGEDFENLHRDFIGELVDEILFIRQILGVQESKILEEKINNKIEETKKQETKIKEEENFNEAIEIYKELIGRYNDYENWSKVQVEEFHDNIEDFLKWYENDYALDIIELACDVANNDLTLARQIANSRIKQQVSFAKNDCIELVTQIKKLVTDKRKLEKIDTNDILDEF